MTLHRPDPGVRPGEFPFPLSNGPDESRYLTWIRNHSNYMAVRGLFDYVRFAAVLVRGALLNFLVGFPLLLVMAVAVAMDKVWPATLNFPVARSALMVGLLAVLLSPVGRLLAGVFNYRKTQQSGSESTVQFRDGVERLFAGLLVLIVATAAFESLPLLLDRLHELRGESGGMVSWQGAAAVSGALIVYSLADRLLARLGGVAKQLAMLSIGALAIAVPLVVMLSVADFIVYGQAQQESITTLLSWTGLLLLSVTLIGAMGLIRRSLSLKDLAYTALLFIASLTLVATVFLADEWMLDSYLDAERELAGAVDGLNDGNEAKLEFDRFKSAIAENPGPQFQKLIDTIALTATRPGEVTGGRPKFDSANPFYRLKSDAEAAHAWETVSLADTLIAVGDSELLAATRGIADRVQRLRKLVANDTTVPGKDLLHRTLESGESLDSLIRQDYARLEADASVMKHAAIANLAFRADRELTAWGTLLRDARLEIAATAVNDPFNYPTIYLLTADARIAAIWPKVILVLVVGMVIWAFCWVAVDVNHTSIHGLWRDRLAAAFLVGADRKGDVDIEEDIDLGDLARHEAGSIAPYHLINVALNLQGSDDIDLRDRRSDFFIFSKRYIGSRRTGYCRSEVMERVYPHMGLGTAMAISAAAASPNMGRATSPGLVAFMTLLNIRLGVWVPNPAVLQREIAPHEREPEDGDGSPTGSFSFPEVFRYELSEMVARWDELGPNHGRRLASRKEPSVAHGLVGLAFSGGGIRSATLNLGIAQALHQRGVFAHADYLSTVSGGGYLGASLSSIMRSRTPTESEIDGVASVRTTASGDHEVEVRPSEPMLARYLPGRRPLDAPRTYRFKHFARLSVADGERVYAGQRLVDTGLRNLRQAGSFGEVFKWRVPPRALLRELRSKLDDRWRWVNVSDGGHIENLATFELLRRRCKFIIIGDAESDPHHQFNGLATLIRTARIDLGVRIELSVDALRLGDARFNTAHWAVGRIHYPPVDGQAEVGWLLYLKSSLSQDEDEVIREYRSAHPSFPHESTADQAFTEGQFEAYRSLGQHIAECALKHLQADDHTQSASYADLEPWFKQLEAAG